MKNTKLIVSYAILSALLIASFSFNIFQHKKYNAMFKKSNAEIKELKNKLDKKQERHPIEIKIEECIKKTTFSKLEISKCTVESEAEWNKEISKHLAELKENLSKEEYELLLKSQKAWENYREIQKELIYSTIFNKHLTGYINITISDDMAIETIKQREKFLSLLNSYMKK